MLKHQFYNRPFLNTWFFTFFDYHQLDKQEKVILGDSVCVLKCRY